MTDGVITDPQAARELRNEATRPAPDATTAQEALPGVPDPVIVRANPWRRRVGRFVRKPGLVLATIWLALVVLAAVAPGLLTSRDPLAAVPSDKLSAPSWNHVFGTDSIGRDLFARTVHGADLSVRAAVIATVVGLVIGSLIGLVAGFVRGWVDEVLMRLVDVMLSIPALLTALALIAVLGSGTYKVALAVGIASVAGCSRVMRAEVLRVRQSMFVDAAQSSGSRPARVLFLHVLPNSLGPVTVLAALQFGTAILAVSALSFLGYGAQPPTPEWGALVSDGRNALRTSWWLTTLPGVVVAVTVIAVNRVSRALDGDR